MVRWYGETFPANQGFVDATTASKVKFLNCNVLRGKG